MTADAEPASREPAGPAPRWRGRLLAFAAILLIGLNLRTAVAVLSPILDQVGDDIALGSVGVGVLGLLPPVCFAVFGLAAPALQRRLGLETVMVAAMAATLAGHLVRAFSGDYPVLVAGSTLTFAGMGMANILIPPLVRRYFPDRIGFVTSLYATVMAVGATLPPLLVVPVAEGAGWRTAVGMWAVFTVLALAPLVALTVRGRAAGEQDAAGSAPDGAPSARRGHVLRSSLAWSLMLVFAFTALNAYAMFAWLPEILRDVAGVDAATAGALLSLFSVMGLPASLLVPLLASRRHAVGWMLAIGVACYGVGYLGLLLAPTAATVLWVVFIGLGPLLFPLCLVLINLRTRTQPGTVALSSFVQGIGYAVGALGPLLLGVLHDATGGWTASLLFLLGVAVALAIAGFVVAKPRMLEDQWHN
ncbi:MFS transporter [Herbiconiux moechotypicola]|uniref:MFS transporter n=1 Tax=Herbiconiux moechotypicola TaxID=637393 RepID=A0ABN3D7Y6_9MICO|nr:MFS transporter [Herbiconiux moechotypicola]MCS5728453.1 MFS transporter [Herbiconiux moechotypicola]